MDRRMRAMRLAKMLNRKEVPHKSSVKSGSAMLKKISHAPASNILETTTKAPFRITCLDCVSLCLKYFEFNMRRLTSKLVMEKNAAKDKIHRKIEMVGAQSVLEIFYIGECPEDVVQKEEHQRKCYPFSEEPRKFLLHFLFSKLVIPP